MQVTLVSIAPVPETERTERLGHYRVVLRADAIEQTLTYTVELEPGRLLTTWQPSESILSDPRVDGLVNAAVTDLVVAFHRGEAVQFPCEVPPKSIGPDTVFIRL